VVEQLGVTPPVSTFSLRIDADGAALSAYASVIDNHTNDPVLYAPYPLGDAVVTVPGVAHLPGTGGSLWRTDLTISNTAEEPIHLRIDYVPQAELPQQYFLNVILPARESMSFPDILGTTLIGPDVATKGHLMVSGQNGDPAPLVAARTYNQTELGTYGQALKVFSSADLISAGARGFIPAVADTDRFRTNLGLLNTGEQETVVAIRVFDASGELLAAIPTFPLGAGAARQFDLFEAVGLAGLGIEGTVEVVPGSGGPVAAYASIVDNGTQDPILVPAQVPR
jgi:hypothetical protein